MSADDAMVLIVDDDASVRRSISRLVRTVGYRVQTFSSPVDFLRQALPSGPACVLLDMRMDGLNGLEVQDALRKNARHIPIVFLSGHGTVATAATSIKRGADDFLEKPIRPKELIAALERAIERDRSSSEQRGKLAAARHQYNSLTPREREVMELVVDGMLNKQVADELGISEKTVKVHRARVIDKMQVDSLAELVRIAERMDIAAAVPTRATADAQRQ